MEFLRLDHHPNENGENFQAMFQTTSQYNKHWDSNGFEILKIQLEEMSNWNSQKMFFGNEILPGLSLPKRSSHSDLRPPNFEDQSTTPKHRNIDIWTHNDPYIVYWMCIVSASEGDHSTLSSCDVFNQYLGARQMSPFFLPREIDCIQSHGVMPLTHVRGDPIPNQEPLGN